MAFIAVQGRLPGRDKPTRTAKSVDQTIWPLLVGISSIPVAWVLGVGFIWYHVLAVIWALRNPKAFNTIGLVDIAFYLLVFTLFISLTLSPARGYGTADRMFGAGNNISLIVVYYLCLKTAKYVAYSGFITENVARSLTNSIRNIFLLMVFGGLVLSVIWYAMGQKDWSVRTIFGLITPDFPGIIAEYQDTPLINTDYLFGVKIPRVSIFAPFATTAAAMLVLLSGIGYLLKAGSGGRQRKSQKQFGFLSYIAVFMTIARASVFAVTVAWIVRHVVGRGRIFGVIAILMAAFGLYYLHESGVGLFDLLNEARPGSNAARLGNYDASISLVMSESPYFGLGVKPRLDVSFIPLGSHSSWISFLVRGGIIGATLAALVYIGAMSISVFRIVLGYANGSRKYDLNAMTGAMLALGFVAYYSVQDADAYGVVAFLAGIYTGLLSLVAMRGRIVPQTESASITPDLLGKGGRRKVL